MRTFREVGREAVIAGRKAKAPPDVKNRNDRSVQVDHAEGHGRGLGRGDTATHRERPLDCGEGGEHSSCPSITKTTSRRGG